MSDTCSDTKEQWLVDCKENQCAGMEGTCGVVGVGGESHEVGPVFKQLINHANW